MAHEGCAQPAKQVIVPSLRVNAPKAGNSATKMPCSQHFGGQRAAEENEPARFAPLAQAATARVRTTQSGGALARQRKQIVERDPRDDWRGTKACAQPRPTGHRNTGSARRAVEREARAQMDNRPQQAAALSAASEAPTASV
jgi:hypothetical protein